MQQMLPLFPAKTAMITPTLGIYKKDTIITYLHCGVPIFSHAEEDRMSFRFITSKFILQGLCRLIEISSCFNVSYDSVKRYVKRLDEMGDAGFFSKGNRMGHSSKLLPVVIERMQRYMDKGKSNCEIARLEDVTEGAVRYALKKGQLKKIPQ